MYLCDLTNLKMLLIEMTDTRTGTLIQYQFMATNYSKTAIYPTNKKN